jgi:hypothetical protein
LLEPQALAQLGKVEPAELVRHVARNEARDAPVLSANFPLKVLGIRYIDNLGAARA